MASKGPVLISSLKSKAPSQKGSPEEEPISDGKRSNAYDFVTKTYVGTKEPLADREQSVSIASPKPLADREQSVSIASPTLSSKNDSVSIASPKPLADREQSVSIASPKPLAEKAFEDLAGKELLLLSFLFQKNRQNAALKEAKISTDELRRFLGVSAVRLRNLIHRLQVKNVLLVSSVKNGRSGWRKFTLNEGICQQMIMAETVSNALAMREHSVSQTVSNASPKPLASSLEEEDIITINKSSSSQPKQFTQLPPDWISIDFSEFNELSIPFGQNHVRQIFEQGRISAQELQDSISHYSYDLRVTPGRKNAIQNHLGYFLNSLKNGPYAPPKGYKSPAELAREEYLRAKKEEAERLEKFKSELFETEYAIWWGKLSVDEQKKITAFEGIRGKVESQRAFKDTVWPTKIKELAP